MCLAAAPIAAVDPPQVIVSSLETRELRDFEKNPPAIQALIVSCLELTTRSLGYKMGSADPTQGGMDCSGAIYCTLRQAGVADVPRSSHEQYRWVWQSGRFRAVCGSTFDSFEFSALRPGDLLFWT
ncbi:MAG: NlpC/P60 family protein, partial [Verrucomicrobiales bacterium]